MFNMLTSSVKKMYFLLNHIPEKICNKSCCKIVVKLNGHSYVVLKYVVAKQINRKKMDLAK